MGHPLCTAVILAASVLVLTLLMSCWHFKVHEAVVANETIEEDLLLKSTAILDELDKRRQEIRTLTNSSEVQRFMDTSETFEQQSFEGKHLENGNTVSIGSIIKNPDHIGCAQLVNVRSVDVLGSGYTKIVLQVVLSEGHTVALKTVYDQGTDIRRCLEEFNDPLGCHKLVAFKLKKEIVLLQRLQHPNIIKLRGHCEVSSGDITAVLEQGQPLQMIQLLQSTWEERFRVCLGLTRLLHYLSNSPLGSVALLDFQPRQFVMVDGELKLTDLDDAILTEPVCQLDQDCVLQFPLRNFSLPCSPQGVCEGMNSMRNLYNAYRYFFTYLLPHQTPPALKHLVDNIMNTTGELRSSINDTLEAFKDVLHLYRSGLHLDSYIPSLIRDYAVMRGVSTSGNMDYRCWPSYSQFGCLLSVHSVREAAFICNSHPQCSSFRLSKQRTWTGRLLASFQSSFSHLVPDGNSEVYMKKTKAPSVDRV